MGTEEAQIEILTAGGGHPVLMVITCRNGEESTEDGYDVKELDGRPRNEINRFPEIHMNSNGYILFCDLLCLVL